MPRHCFAHVLSKASDNLDPPWWDRILKESRSFVVIVSIGAIVPGWMLVIPKRRISNLSLLTVEEREELVGLRAQVTRSISTGGSKIFEFEHGDFVGGPHGCGVDQAHLHLVPLSFDLISAARHAEPSLYWHAQNGLPDWTGNCNPYLYVGVPNKHGCIAYPEQPKSQWFRKLIAAESGQPHFWNYKKFPLYKNVVETIGTVQQQFLTLP